jgi:arginine utilization protein RocB
MPDRVWLAFNVLTQVRTPAEILHLFAAEVHVAMSGALDRYADLAARYPGVDSARFSPRVLTFAELQQLAGERGGPHSEALSATDAADPLAITPRIVEAAHRRLAESAEAAARETAALYDTSIGFQQYFAGISDMSFLGSRAAGLELVAVNTPSKTFVDQPADEVLLFPVINIGPWGREYHQKLERVHAHYAFEVLPALLSRTAALLLADRA